jgi:rhamnogalacturonyl hydrolase YesR
MKYIKKNLTAYTLLTFFMTTVLYAQDCNLTDFPEKSRPEEIGRLLVNKYLSRPLSVGEKRNYVFYSEVCTWLGSLWYADANGDETLYNRLADRFNPLFNEQKEYCPVPDHVDRTVFGSIPLSIFQKRKEQRYLDLGLKYADAQWELPENFTEKQKSWVEKGYSWQTRMWIDDMFMITAVQSQAYMATGNLKYIDRAAAEMAMYLKELQRPDGLFYHTPSVPFYWGRGDGWVAVGMTEVLRMLPNGNSNKKIIMESYGKMMAALLQYQAEDGMWRQLIDDPGSWKETSSTAMFLYAMITGVKNGWLDEKTYGTAARKAWLTLITYINENGEITDVCQGTGAKNDYQYYLDRERKTGDYHGQAPVIWCAYALIRKTENLWPAATTIMQKADGFKGIWYMNQRSNDEYVYKYSGGLGTYPANHRPFAIYNKETDKTFFCFGATNDKNSTLYHNVSYFDHKTGKVARPLILLNKRTTDAHDNPVISIDDRGYVWIFSTSHGVGRASYIHKSKKPYDISEFVMINATETVNGKEIAFTNFSYFQVYHIRNKGFIAMFTKYIKGERVIGFNTSADGIRWNEWKILAHINKGHYQVSAESNGKVCVAFDYHPNGKGLNYRTNLYYLESSDFGQTWKTRAGETVNLPLTAIENPALVHDFATHGLNCYLLDIALGPEGEPAILVISSKGYQSGPQNDPRNWHLFRYDKGWYNQIITSSDNNYDMGSIYIETAKKISVIGPTLQGPQSYNTGGEIAVWNSKNGGKTWKLEKQLTKNSPRNHTYVRRPLNVHPDFFAIWADGHGRQPSESYLYFSNKKGEVFRLSRENNNEMIIPEKYK